MRHFTHATLRAGVMQVTKGYETKTHSRLLTKAKTLHSPADLSYNIPIPQLKQESLLEAEVRSHACKMTKV